MKKAVNRFTAFSYGKAQAYNFTGLRYQMK